MSQHYFLVFFEQQFWVKDKIMKVQHPTYLFLDPCNFFSLLNWNFISMASFEKVEDFFFPLNIPAQCDTM